MSKNDVLVVISAIRKKGELQYKVDCSSRITKEEFEYYLGEIIKGICEWKPDICEENIRSYKGTIRPRKTRTTTKQLVSRSRMGQQRRKKKQHD